MSKATKKSILYALGVLALIALAMWLRYASRHIFHSPAVSHLRSGIYVFLFSAWCYSIWMRIVQTQVRRYLLAISVLMVLWILLRSIKFSIDNMDAERWLWYFYYLPMLLIPMLSVFVSWSLGKGEDFQLPRWTKLLYFPTLLLLLLVLTNDLHQQVFSFPSGVLSDQEYRYEGGYFFVLGWVALCAGFALLSMVKNCRIPRSRRIRWLPLVPLALSLVYACMYPFSFTATPAVVASTIFNNTSYWAVMANSGGVSSSPKYKAVMPQSGSATCSLHFRVIGKWK